MRRDPAYDLESARKAAARDEIAQWIGEFLASRGSDNEVLAAALAQERHAWLGPVRLPIDLVVPLSGPDDQDDTLCSEDADHWRDEVEQMEEHIEEGWEPPPILVEHQHGKLLVQDGNHRLTALADAGETHCWAVVYFDDEAARERFITARPELGDALDPTP